MANKRVRLKDIAKAAGTSMMSLSHVLNGSGVGRVSESKERACHIIKIANEMDYIPNHVARALRRASTQVIGTLIRGAVSLLPGVDYAIIGWGNAAVCDYMNPRLSSVGLDLPTVMRLALQSFLKGTDAEIFQVHPLFIKRETHQIKS
ncbi:LacI family DNA-binding transcriptional regulator [Verrucomicrobiaceae bacterium N1E253]|uniref:LacI family DNA-binding transcriptional regulator n=1 Tax=Oceaniferula marina TaxID=2748318 RepID=A0A851G9J2_9BACT|nr:LacI family DNA-binding transcriptional regulator [Oceaniferula marina]